MFLRQGMGLWSGTALPKTRIKAESMKAENRKQKSNISGHQRLNNEGTKEQSSKLTR
jgi:hypothetical protein